ncbi:hypothetical protein Tco_0666142 [Tanacetum coccineum]
MKIDGRTKKVIFHALMNGSWNKRRMDDRILSNNNTTTDSFFKPYLITHGKSNTEKDDEQSQTKRKYCNASESLDEQPNKRMCKAEKFKAIEYSLGTNEEYIADLVKEILTNIGEEFTNMEILKCWSLETSRRNGYLRKGRKTKSKRQNQTQNGKAWKRQSQDKAQCMRTRSQSRNLNRQQQQAPPAFVEPFNLEEPIENPAPPVVTMDDNRTMAQLLEAPTEGYEDAIVVPEITANNFKHKHDHFYDEVPERPEFQQRFDETFYEAWDRFKDLLRACTHHGFSELHQLNTFYNALNSNDQDSLNSATGGNFLDKMPRDCLRIIKSKSKVRNSRNKPVVAKVSSSSSTPGISPDVAELKDIVKALLLDKKSQASTPVKTVEESCVTCGGTHSYRNCPATNGNVYRDNIQE